MCDWIGWLYTSRFISVHWESKSCLCNMLSCWLPGVLHLFPRLLQWGLLICQFGKPCGISSLKDSQVVVWGTYFSSLELICRLCSAFSVIIYFRCTCYPGLPLFSCEYHMEEASHGWLLYMKVRWPQVWMVSGQNVLQLILLRALFIMDYNGVLWNVLEIISNMEKQCCQKTD